MPQFDENRRRVTSPTKRLGVSLNVDTEYNKGKEEDLSPPLTPESKPTQLPKANITAANRALKIKTGPRETFLDDITPIDRLSNKENEVERERHNINRDSHDLSLGPRNITRDSLVDHMLLSLDQLSFDHTNFTASFGERNPTVEEEQLYSSFNDREEPYNSTQRTTRGVPTHHHSYSYSSDYDNADDSSRYSERPSRGRRSNSSSNFPTGLNRIKTTTTTTTTEGRTDTTTSHNITGARGPPMQISGHQPYARSGKGSSTASVDLGYSQTTSTQQQRRNQTPRGRSSSFDYGSDRQSILAQANIMATRMNPSVTSFHPYDYEAAPTPTVPGGPRRMRASSPINLPEPPPEPAYRLERKKSSRSTKSAYKGRAHTSSGGGLRQDFGLHDRTRELPALPAFNKAVDHTPGPSVNYGKAKETIANQGQQAPKERPGFFRRVFGGSSRNTSAASTDYIPSHGSSTSVETTDGPSSKVQHGAPQVIKTQQTAPPSQPPSREQPHTLTKKSSSFFRRRKKSVSDAEPQVPVPAVPALLPAERDFFTQPQASPVSSLRKVMNPYLTSPGKLKQSHTHSTLGSQVSDYTTDYDDRDARGFSPEYTPETNATAHKVRPRSKDGLEMLSREDTNISMSQGEAALGSSVGKSYDGAGTSFLRDSSENGDENSATENLGTPAPDQPKRNSATMPNSTSSNSVARDIALVAEYERTFSRRSPSALARSASPATNSVRSSSVASNQGPSKGKSGGEEEWVMLTPTKSDFAAPPKDSRVWLEPTSSEEDLNGNQSLSVPAEGHPTAMHSYGSSDTIQKSVSSLPILQVDGLEHEDEDEDDGNPSSRLMTAAEAIKALDDPPPEVDMTPTEGERDKARKIYDGNEDFIQKEKAAAWMGDEGPVRYRTLVAYMELYDFANLNILAALRSLCNRLVLRGESQQVDRILDAFAHRWCRCNSNHGFKVIDVVHTICYSLLLLNTDLHLADIDQKMTRSQFIKNTMPTIRRAVTDSMPDAFESRPTVIPGKSQTFADPSTGKQGPEITTLKAERPSVEIERPSWRHSFKPAPRADPENGVSAPTPLDYDAPLDDCGPLVKAPFNGTLRTWEVQVEIVLKDFYISIRNERLPLFGAPIEKPLPVPTNSLSVFTNGMLRRTPSVMSKTPSETQSYLRGRTADTVRGPNGKWSTKTRSRGRVYPNSGMASSRTSLDDQSSMWSPSVNSSTWSKYSLGKTQTSLSVDSVSSGWPNSDYQQSIGFANALSQAIIREETHTSRNSISSNDEPRVAPLLEDESLELAGAPWAKEGILKHKHHLESVDKKAKDRNWAETFAVIEKGYMSLFSFSSKSTRQKSKSASKGQGNAVVGGGNWQENAESLGSFLLRQTIASALPSPGYSKARPHVWALSLPTGAVHLFQVGTPDIVKEFVSTANYWSARLSNHPLIGGISNIEYGWGDSIVNNALVNSINEAGRPSIGGGRSSMQSSLRTSLDQGSGVVRGRLPGDKITISDWTPPTQSMRSSNLMEEDQLKTLTDYVSGIEEELQKHNLLRSPMQLAFTPRHPNSQKAMHNWEKKSSYLLREIVKFRTYIDILQAATAAKEAIYMERAKQKEMTEVPEDNEAHLSKGEE